MIVILVAIGSWFAGSTIQSPAEAAARSAPPTPSPILVPVEARVLTADIVTRGTARYGAPTSISLVPSSLKSNVGVITTLPTNNTQLHDGDVMFTVSGRPVFLLQGERPAYRDFVPGLSGEDVGQLEASLKRLGFDPGSVDGIYDEQTSTAVFNWYASSEWQPLEATSAQQTNIRSLEDKLVTAVNEKLAAEDAAAAAPLAVAAAQARAEAENAASVADETAALATQLAGQVAVQAAVDAQKAAEREAQSAAQRVEQLSADLEIARYGAGVKMAVDEIIFLPDLPVRVEDVHVDVGDEARGNILTVTNNQLVIDSSLPLDEGALVKPGMVVTIDEPNLGIEAEGVVKRVADTPGTDGVDGFHIYFEVLVDAPPTTLEGFSLRLTIPIESTGEKVTAVPVSALSLAADGTTRVQVKNNGTLAFVVVEPGLSANGFVEVTPLDGTLTPGQLVVIGYE